MAAAEPEIIDGAWWQVEVVGGASGTFSVFYSPNFGFFFFFGVGSILSTSFISSIPLFGLTNSL